MTITDHVSCIDFAPMLLQLAGIYEDEVVTGSLQFIKIHYYLYTFTMSELSYG